MLILWAVRTRHSVGAGQKRRSGGSDLSRSLRHRCACSRRLLTPRSACRRSHGALPVTSRLLPLPPLANAASTVPPRLRPPPPPPQVDRVPAAARAGAVPRGRRLPRRPQERERAGDVVELGAAVRLCALQAHLRVRRPARGSGLLLPRKLCLGACSRASRSGRGGGGARRRAVHVGRALALLLSAGRLGTVDCVRACRLCFTTVCISIAA
jgi:hypothetical protein